MYWGSVCDVSALCEVWRDRAVGGTGWELGTGTCNGEGGGGIVRATALLAGG